MNTVTHTGGEIAARSPEADRADGYETRQIHPASRTERKPDGQPDAADRDNGRYVHREIAPQGKRADRRDVPPPPPQPRTCFVSFREADFAAPPCCR